MPADHRALLARLRPGATRFSDAGRQVAPSETGLFSGMKCRKIRTARLKVRNITPSKSTLSRGFSCNIYATRDILPGVDCSLSRTVCENAGIAVVQNPLKAPASSTAASSGSPEEFQGSWPARRHLWRALLTTVWKLSRALLEAAASLSRTSPGALAEPPLEHRKPTASAPGHLPGRLYV